MKDLEARSGGLYRASACAIYPTLQQLEDEGMITSEQAEGKRGYRLTTAGKKELKESVETVNRIWKRARSWGGWSPWLGPAASLVAGPASSVMKAAMRAATHASENPERIAKIRGILDHTPANSKISASYIVGR